jgi:hypothetical protein
LTNEGLADLTALKDLESLYFRRSQVTTSGLKVLAGLPRLTELMAHDLGQDEELMDVSGLTQLKKLTLIVAKSAHFRDEDLACLADLTGLRWLTVSRPGLSSEGISDAGMSHLAGLTAIERLSIGGPGVTDAGLAYLTRMSWLNHLAVRGNFTDVGLRHLERLEMLGYVNLTGEHEFTPGGVQHLQESLPGVMLVGVDAGDGKSTPMGMGGGRHFGARGG